MHFRARCRPTSPACRRLNYYNADGQSGHALFRSNIRRCFIFLLLRAGKCQGPTALGRHQQPHRAGAPAELGEWDPYNVTGRRRFGIRLARAGLQTRMLDSYTLEEAEAWCACCRGSASARAGSRAICRPGWCICAIRRNYTADFGPRGFSSSSARRVGLLFLPHRACAGVGRVAVVDRQPGPLSPRRVPPGCSGLHYRQSWALNPFTHWYLSFYCSHSLPKAHLPATKRCWPRSFFIRSYPRPALPGRKLAGAGAHLILRPHMWEKPPTASHGEIAPLFERDPENECLNHVGQAGLRRSKRAPHLEGKRQRALKLAEVRQETRQELPRRAPARAGCTSSTRKTRASKPAMLIFPIPRILSRCRNYRCPAVSRLRIRRRGCPAA